MNNDANTFTNLIRQIIYLIFMYLKVMPDLKEFVKKNK